MPASFGRVDSSPPFQPGEGPIDAARTIDFTGGLEIQRETHREGELVPD
jgi:hypothetical protein